MGLVTLWHVRSSQTRDGTRDRCISRRILNHWTPRKSRVWALERNVRRGWRMEMKPQEGNTGLAGKVDEPWGKSLENESEVKVLVAQSCQTLCDPMDCSPPASSVHRDFPGKNTGVGFMPSSRGSSQPRDRTQSPTLQVDSLPTERPGKPKHTEVGSLSLLQRIFLTQELNRGLLHCKRILY